MIVTGGAGGIGQAIAARALHAGARVSLWDRDQAALQRAAAKLSELGDVEQRAVDVTDEHGVACAMEQDIDRHRRIDAFINNAGVLGEVAPLWDTDPMQFRRVVEVNLTGAYLCMRAVLRAMRAQEASPMRGHIVNVASIQGKEGMALAGAYSASKAALIALTKTAGKEAARERIIVNCITPAAAETAMARQISAERRADILSRIPMGRFAELDEIAAMVMFLCSDDCSFSTGAVFDVSGGRATY